jgi:carbonic anhydrase
MSSPTPETSALEVLSRLRLGNTRFSSNLLSVEALASIARRGELVDGQSPMAIILSCSDSRVPAEIIFDCGLGDLFVVRVAGNIVAPSLIGSVEFAAARFGTRLAVVLGHSGCGAVAATLESISSGTPIVSENIRDIVSRIAPSVQDLVQQNLPREELMRKAVRANVRATANHLRHGSTILERLCVKEGLVVVGAEYSLQTGVVDFFDGVPTS